MAALKLCLGDALSGQGRLVMLAGESGIGKTRTAQELVNHALARDVAVWWGRCHSSQGAPPFWPWIQIIRSYCQTHDDEQLISAMGPGASELSLVVPEVRERFPGLDPPSDLGPQHARFRLVESISTFFKRAAQARPLLLVLDNLHWADQPSLQSLETLSQELPGTRLLVLGTYRDDELARRHPLRRTLGNLTREPSFRRVILRGLGAAEVTRFIRQASSVIPSSGLAQAVHDLTEGNPLFMTEVIQLLLQEGDLAPERSMEPQNWSIRIPVGLHEVIGNRLDRLSEECNRVLTLASVIGHEFELGLLENLVDGLSGERVLEALEEALEARVVEELPDAAGRYKFVHVLTQETLNQELSAARRARLHRRIAESLEELYAVNLEVHASRIACHFAQAAPGTDVEKLTRYSLMAGDRALATYGFEDAVSHYERALTAREGHPIDGQMAALLFGLGRANIATLPRHRMSEAVAPLRRAFDYYVETGDVSRAVAVATYPVPTLAGHLAGVPEMVARALQLVPANSKSAGELLCTYGRVISLQEGKYREAQDAFARAQTIARAFGETQQEIEVLVNAIEVDWYYGRWQDLVDRGVRVIALSRGGGYPYASALSHYLVGMVLLVRGNLERARPHAMQGLAMAERLRDRQRLAGALFINGSLASLEGDWSAARGFYDRGLSTMPSDPRLLTGRALLEYEVGDFDAGAAYLERLREQLPTDAPVPGLEHALVAVAIPLAARISGVSDRNHQAEAAADIVLSSTAVTPAVAAIARVGLAVQAVNRNDAVAAQAQLVALDSARNTIMPGTMISTDRLLGLLAETTGKIDIAIGHFDAALSFCRNAGFRPEYARTACDQANILLQRNCSGDPKRAAGLLEESFDIARQLGMAPLLQQVVARQAQAEAEPRQPPQYPDGLTHREVEVLQLIARGRSNRDIAQDLVLSVRTVERHITNIYGKINARGRADATAYTLSHHLLPI